MLLEIVLFASAAGMVAGVFQAVSRRRNACWTREAAVREAMRGPEAVAVRAEFNRSGIIPPVRRPEGTRGAIVF